jgi:hypothetical protein
MSDIVKVNEFIERSDGGLRGAILHADTLRQELAERGDYTQLLYAMQGLRAIKADLDTLLREVENDVARLLPEKKMAIDNIGQVERRTSITRKWESESLLTSILKETLTDKETGELSPQVLARVDAVLKAALPLTGSLGWRITGLQAIGIDPDEYCDKTFGRQTIQIIN